MSIPAAVVELDKAIAQLDKKRERLVGLRDALIKEEPKEAGSIDSIDVPVPPKKAAVKKKSAAVKKTSVAKKVAPAKKRKLSPEGRKRISDAAKARWAKKAATAA